MPQTGWILSRLKVWAMTSFNYHEYRAAIRVAPRLKEKLLKDAEQDPQISPEQLKKLKQYADKLGGRK